MTISTNYATPVWVNGYQCKNCTDVDNAKKHIDPAHPKSGPFGIDAKSDPTVADNPTVVAKAATAPGAASPSPASSTPGVGALVDVTV